MLRAETDQKVKSQCGKPQEVRHVRPYNLTPCLKIYIVQLWSHEDNLHCKHKQQANAHLD